MLSRILRNAPTSGLRQLLCVGTAGDEGLCLGWGCWGAVAPICPDSPSWPLGSPALVSLGSVGCIPCPEQSHLTAGSGSQTRTWQCLHLSWGASPGERFIIYGSVGNTGLAEAKSLQPSTLNPALAGALQGWFKLGWFQLGWLQAGAVGGQSGLRAGGTCAWCDAESTGHGIWWQRLGLEPCAIPCSPHRAGHSPGLLLQCPRRLSPG